MSKKKNILLAATQLFSQKGYRNTSMAEVSKLTGVAGGTIFYHYKTKEALFLSILKDLKDRILLEFDAYQREKTFSSGFNRFEGAISFYLGLAHDMEDGFMLLHRHDPYALAQVNPIGRQHLEAIYTCLVGIFEQAIIAGQKDGSVRSVPTRKTAMIIFAMVDGIVRLNTYKLYDAAALYKELMASCRRMLQNNDAFE